MFAAETDALREEWIRALSGANDGRRPLHSAAQDGHTDAIEALLAREDVDVNAADNFGGFRPLHAAARYGHDTIALQLLNAGATLDPLGNHNRTPLLAGALEGHALPSLLFRGADINARDGDGVTPLVAVACKGKSNDGIRRGLGRRSPGRARAPRRVCW